MFEDSTFESTGRIHTRSRSWMVAALALNSSILLAVIMIPLIYPEALPLHSNLFLIAVPPPPSSPAPSPHPAAHPPSGSNAPVVDPFTAPPRIPTNIADTAGPEPPAITGTGSSISGESAQDSIGVVLRPQPEPRVVHVEPKTTARLSSTVAAGLLVYKVIPHYPVLAQQIHLEGTVVLEATISKDGTIANLRVVSGPALLQQAAVGAVRDWRYRPYLLNGQPVDVETTVNVNFKLGG